MAEDRESSDRKHEKSKKRDRSGKKVDNKIDKRIWTEEEKLLLAEAIDMFGIVDLKRLSSHVQTKTNFQILHMLRKLRQEYRKEIEYLNTEKLRFVDLNNMDDLFLAGGTKPKDVLVKWMDYLEMFYDKDPYQYDKFKLFSSAFLIMSECENTTDEFKRIYYFLYRVFNNYHVSKNNLIQSNLKKHLYDMFFQVLEDIKYTSDGEKVAMFNIVSNWTSCNREKSVRVYSGKSNTKIKTEPEEDTTDEKTTLMKPEYKVLCGPMIPSFNPLKIKSTISHTVENQS